MKEEGKQGRARNIEWSSFDWADVKQRVAAVGQALQATEHTSPEEARLILEQRARDLARSATNGLEGATIEAVTFSLGGQRYAIESTHVAEVFRLLDLTLLPNAHETVIGLTAWRGRLLIILDLRKMLGQPSRSLDDQDRVIVLGDVTPSFGILSDTVPELRTVAVADIHEPPGSVSVDRRFVRGVADDALLVLEAKEVLLAGDEVN